MPVGGEGGMAPSVWGPMAWRLLHGMAHKFDRCLETITRPQILVFVKFLQELAWVLPCVHCRNSYTDYILDEYTSGQLFTYFSEQQVRYFIFTLHNKVNQKLHKAEFEDFEIVKRRSKVWECEFLEAELLGLCYIVALNFDGNGEPGKEQHYLDFLVITNDLSKALGAEQLRQAFHRTPFDLTQPVTQRRLTDYMYALYLSMGGVESQMEVEERFSLCKSMKKSPRKT
jgi:hypothetical protein